MRQTADDEPVREWSTAPVAPAWLQELPLITLAVFIALALLVLVACLALLGRRRRGLQGECRGRLCVLHAGDQESARAAGEIASRLRALGGAVAEMGGEAAEVDPVVADVTLCVLTPTIFAAERVRAHLALLLREAAVVIPVHSGDCHPRDDLIPLIGCRAAELVGRDLSEESDEAAELRALQRYLFRENVRDVHNSAHEAACAATLEQLVARASEVSSQRASPEAVPAAHYRHDVFISYHARDAWDVFESTFATLEGLGASVFNPSKDLQRTQVSSSEMVKHVQGSRCLLQVLTPNYVQSKWCRAELAAAEAAGLPIYVLYAGKKHTQAQLVRMLDATPEPGCKDADAIQQARETIRRAVQRRGLADVYNPDFAADTAEALEAIAYTELVALRCRRRLRLAACAALILLVLALCLCAVLAYSWRRMQLSCLKGDWEELQYSLGNFSSLGRDAWFLGPMQRCLTRLTAERDFELFAKNRSIGHVGDIARTMADAINQNDTVIVRAGVRAIKDLESCSQEAQDIVEMSVRLMGTNVDLLLRSYEALLPCAQNRRGGKQLVDPCGTVCTVTWALDNHSTDVRVHSNTARLLRNIAIGGDGNVDAPGAAKTGGSISASNRKTAAPKGTALANCSCVAAATTAVRGAMARFEDPMLQMRSCRAVASLAALEAEPARRREAAAQLVSTWARFKDAEVRSAALEGLSLLANRSLDVQKWLARNATAVELAVAVVTDTARLDVHIRKKAVDYLAQLAAQMPEELQISGSTPPGRGALGILVDVAVQATDVSVSDVPPGSALRLLEELGKRADARAQLLDAGVAKVLAAAIEKVPAASPEAARAMKLLWWLAQDLLAQGGREAMFARMVQGNASGTVVKVLQSPFATPTAQDFAFKFLAILSQVPGLRQRLVKDGAVHACIASLDAFTRALQSNPIPEFTEPLTTLLSNLAEDPENLVPMVSQGAAKYSLVPLSACVSKSETGCALQGWALRLLARYTNRTDSAKLMVREMLANRYASILDEYLFVNTRGNVHMDKNTTLDVLHILGALTAGGRAARTVLECDPVGLFYMVAAEDFPGDLRVQRGLVDLVQFYREHSDPACTYVVLPEVARAMALFPQDVRLQTSAARLAYDVATDNTDLSPLHWVVKYLGRSLIETLRVHGSNRKVVFPALMAFNKAGCCWGNLPTATLVPVTTEIMQRAARAGDDLLAVECMAVLNMAAKQGRQGLSFFTTLDAASNASSPTPALIQIIQVLRDFPLPGLHAQGVHLLSRLSASRPGVVAMAGAQVVPMIQGVASNLTCCQYLLNQWEWIGQLMVLTTNLALAGLVDAALAQTVVLSPAGCSQSPRRGLVPGNVSRVMLEQAIRLAGQPSVRDALLKVGFMPALSSAVQVITDSVFQRPGVAVLCVSVAAELSRAKAHGRQLVLENVTELLATVTRQCGAVAPQDRAALAAGAVEALAALAEDPAANALLAAHGALGIVRELFGGGCLQLPLPTDGDSGSDLVREAEALQAWSQPHVVYPALRLIARMASAPDNVPRMLRDGAVELIGNLSRGHAGDLNVAREVATALHALAPGAPACRSRSAAAGVALTEGGRLAMEVLQSVGAGACGASAGVVEQPGAATFLATGQLQDGGLSARAG